MHRGVPITYAYQRDQQGLAHVLLPVEEHIDDDFMLTLGDTNLEDVVRRHRDTRADAAFLVEEIPWEDASRYGVCATNTYGEITDVGEKLDEPPSTLVLTGFDPFTPEIFHACHPVRPSNRGAYEISEAIGLLIQSGRTIDAIALERESVSRSSNPLRFEPGAVSRSVAPRLPSIVDRWTPRSRAMGANREGDTQLTGGVTSSLLKRVSENGLALVNH